MGKNKKKQKQKQELPFVSVCTPTFNRRPFINQMIRCFNIQDYPKDKMEWIIIDDGSDPIGDMVKDIPQVKYFYYDKKMSLGKKRNLMHEKTKGDILVYMDDDDYYPKERISHAVYMLQHHKNALCAGSSEIYIYFKHITQLYQFGPYGEKHSTAGTFAFKRKLLDITHYEEDAALAEEKFFLKNYTIPFVQLDPYKTILVVSHNHNTFDKKKLLENQDHKYCKSSDVSLSRFFNKDQISFKFFIEDIDDLLKDYKPGEPEMKPDVLKQIKKLTEERENKMIKMQEEQYKQENAPIIIEGQNGEKTQLNNRQITEIIEKQGSKIEELEKENKQLNNKLNNLQKVNKMLIDKLNNK
jgi:glycosyltransferase involved in cell wall biosynthesis